MDSQLNTDARHTVSPPPAPPDTIIPRSHTVSPPPAPLDTIIPRSHTVSPPPAPPDTIAALTRSHIVSPTFARSHTPSLLPEMEVVRSPAQLPPPSAGPLPSALPPSRPATPSQSLSAPWLSPGFEVSTPLRVTATIPRVCTPAHPPRVQPATSNILEKLPAPSFLPTPALVVLQAPILSFIPPWSSMLGAPPINQSVAFAAWPAVQSSQSLEPMTSARPSVPWPEVGAPPLSRRNSSSLAPILWPPPSSSLFTTARNPTPPPWLTHSGP